MIDVLQLERRQGASHVRPALEQALAMGCANLGAIRYLLSVDCGQNNTPTQEVEADALRRYDRPLPSMEAYDSCGPTGRWRRRWSSEHISTIQQATIQQYARQLYLTTVAGQFASLAEEAVRKKQSHLSYLEALLEAETENAIAAP